ncbi:MAG TPA: biotin--[acetyl-CoA-carboxylase] ligase [Spirochaetota bacterium]|nr:biotin--[acetyl-CoA-carboxylase] ligase [Spirochaetota bacterium]
MDKFKKLPDTPAPFTVFHIKKLPSTNTYLKLHHNEYQNYSIVWSDNQTAGKGRFNRKWQTAAGKDLTFSLLIYLKNFTVKQWQNLTQICALAIADLLVHNYQLPAHIKWPNDICVNEKKIAGILCETTANGSGKVAVLGIGLNVNSEKKNLKFIKPQATSLSIELSKDLQRKIILFQILRNFYTVLKKFKHKGFSAFTNEINKRLMYKNKAVSVKAGHKKIRGIIQGVDENGLLVLKQPGKKKITLAAGDISFKKK